MGIADSSSRKQKTDGKDFYQTPYLATEALVRSYSYIHEDNISILDPCCGKEAIGKVLRDHKLQFDSFDKYPAYATIIEKDFLTINDSYDIIIANPPYHLKNEFIEHAISLANEVFMILPTNVINYNHFHRNFLNRKEYRGRLLLTPKFFMNQEINEDYSLKRGGISSYAWFHWSKNKTTKNHSYEIYYDLDVLKKELKNE